MSAADLIAVLIDGHLRADDHLIFSKGHASPLYYAMLKATGRIDDEELLTFRKLGSRLEGHPTPRIPPTDVATGSLGQGLPIAAGVALAGKRLDRLPYRVWCLCGDSEMAEGSMWEAIQHAGWEGLDNLTAILDVNRLGQTRETMLGWDLDAYVRRLRPSAGTRSRSTATTSRRSSAPTRRRRRSASRPTAIVARTHEGPRRQGGRGPARQARQAARRARDGDRGARRRARPARASSRRPRRRQAAPLRDDRRRAADAGSSARRSPPARPTARR